MQKAVVDMAAAKSITMTSDASNVLLHNFVNAISYCLSQGVLFTTGTPLQITTWFAEVQSLVTVTQPGLWYAFTPSIWFPQNPAKEYVRPYTQWIRFAPLTVDRIVDGKDAQRRRG